MAKQTQETALRSLIRAVNRAINRTGNIYPNWDSRTGTVTFFQSDVRKLERAVQHAKKFLPAPDRKDG